VIVLEFSLHLIDRRTLQEEKTSVTALRTDPKTAGARRAPQVVVLLDESANVLSVNKGLAGTGFLGLTEDHQTELHAQIHPDCDGGCRFADRWKKAWNSLATTDSVEWEIDDRILGKMLRLNLTRPPTSRGIDVDRRRRYALLCITDITKHRREYESLVKRERALLKLLRDHGVQPDAPSSDSDLDTTAEQPLMPASYDTRSRSLGRQEILAQELERKRIAAELHDGIAQSVGVIKYQVEASIEQISRAHPDLDISMLEGVIDQTRTVIDEIRRISNNLAPSMLEDFGLCVAVQGICTEFRSDCCDLQPNCETCIDEAELPEIVKFAAYRVVQEALTNISKHSSAKSATVSVTMNDGNLRLEIVDDGVGFGHADSDESTADSTRGLGLQNMRERVVASSGEFAIESLPGEGARILATWAREDLAELLGDESVLNRVDSNG